jgi:hypothetical protein
MEWGCTKIQGSKTRERGLRNAPDFFSTLSLFGSLSYNDYYQSSKFRWTLVAKDPGPALLASALRTLRVGVFHGTCEP